MEKITEILFAEIETETGVKLGRVFEIRSAGEPEHGLVRKAREVNELLYASKGLLEILGLKECILKSVDASKIVRFDRRKVIIAGDTGGKKEP